MFIENRIKKRINCLAAIDDLTLHWSSYRCSYSAVTDKLTSFDNDSIWRNNVVSLDNISSFHRSCKPRLLEWEEVPCLTVDQAPLFLSCSVLDQQGHNLIGITSLEKNRFSELVNFNIENKNWSGCTRTRHFRPPKRIGAAAVWTQDYIFVFGGYELSNKIVVSNTNASFLSNSSDGFTANQAISHDICNSFQQFSSSSSLQLFGHPEWWFNRLIRIQYRDKKTTPMLIEALGDFHAYNLFCGEWNALISRDNKILYDSKNPPKTIGKVSRSATSNYTAFHLSQRIKCEGISNSSRFVSVYQPLNGLLPAPRAFHTLIRCEDTLVLFGGERSPIYRKSCTQKEEAAPRFVPIIQLNDVWIFNMKSMSWRKILDSTLLPDDILSNTVEHYSDLLNYKSLKRYLSDWTAQGQFMPRPTRAPLSSSSSQLLTSSIIGQATQESLPYSQNKYPLSTSPLTLLQKSTSEECGVIHSESNNINFSSPFSKQSSSVADLESSLVQPFQRVQENVQVPSPRSGHCAVVYNKVMYIYGGQNNTEVLGDLWALDLRTFQWRQLKTTGHSPGPRVGHTAVIVGSEAWIYGGFTDIDIKNKISLHKFQQNNSKYEVNVDNCNYELTYFLSRDSSSDSANPPCKYDIEKDTKSFRDKSTSTFNSFNVFPRLENDAVTLFEFSDHHALFCLNFEFLHWTRYECKGSPPNQARFFGRLHGFAHHKFLYFGGIAAETLEFQLSRIDISERKSNIPDNVTTDFFCSDDQRKSYFHDDSYHKSLKHFFEMFSNYEPKKPLLLSSPELDWVLDQNLQGIALQTGYTDRLEQTSLEMPSLALRPVNLCSASHKLANGSTESGVYQFAEFNNTKHFDVDFPLEDMTTTAATSTDDCKQEFFIEDSFATADRSFHC